MSRRRLTAIVVLLALVVAACARSGENLATGVLPKRSVTAGAVDVAITPTRLDEQGATFAISFDTHSVELSSDLTKGAALTVNGVNWPIESWQGDDPGGHHRSGELRFQPGGPARGTAQLTIDGLPNAVNASWELPAG